MVHETHHEAVVQPTVQETGVVHETIPHSFEIPHTESHTTTYEATGYDAAGAYAAYQPYGYGYAQTTAYSYPYY